VTHGFRIGSDPNWPIAWCFKSVTHTRYHNLGHAKESFFKNQNGIHRFGSVSNMVVPSSRMVISRRYTFPSMRPPGTNTVWPKTNMAGHHYDQ